MESAVLEVVRDQMASGDKWSTDEIAKRAGYTNSGAMRLYLKSLAPTLKLKITKQGIIKG